MISPSESFKILTSAEAGLLSCCWHFQVGLAAHGHTRTVGTPAAAARPGHCSGRHSMHGYGSDSKTGIWNRNLLLLLCLVGFDRVLR